MRNLLVIILFSVLGVSLKAQEVRLNLYSAYAFDDHVESYYSYDRYFSGTMGGGFIWGGGIEFMPNENYGIELMYRRIDGLAPLNYNTGTILDQQKTFDYAANYIMLGSQRYLVLADGAFEPFFGIQAGMVVFNLNNPDAGGSSSYTKFAWGLRAGGIVWPTDVVGIRAEFQLNSAVQGAGGGAYFGTGGSGVGISTYSTIYQASVGGGLVFRFNTGS